MGQGRLDPKQGVFSHDLFSRGRSLARDFAEGRPFKHAVVDRFLRPEFCRELLAEFPPYDLERFRNEHGHPGKAHREDVRELGPAYRRLDEALRSKEFLNFMGEISGIGDLLFDPEYFGGGTHENLEDMELDPHVDFTLHPHSGRYRRLNLLLYLNDEWEESWGGALQLHTDPWQSPENDPVTTILPLMNRCVVFATHHRSWHGFQAIRPQPGRSLSRKSFALYLYTNERDAEEPLIPSDLTVFVDRPLPPAIRAGHTLTEDDLATLNRLIVRRDWKLKYLYDRAIRLFNEARTAQELLKAGVLEEMARGAKKGSGGKDK